MSPRALEPAKLSDFKVAGSLGAGATAQVYEATNLKSGQAVAIKMMDDGDSTPEMRERFAREAILLSGVTSRHVSRILGFGFEKGRPFLVLERLNGETLDGKLRRDGPVQPKMAVRWIEQLIVGVRDCHDAKIIHRDIKPSNIFLHHDTFDEVVKVIDFGVARLREIADDGSGALTSANHLIGSMGYMAPEQFLNAKGVHFTADLYAVGVVVFRTLTGRLPFVSRSLQAIIRMKQEQSVPAISSMPNMPKNPLLDWFVQKSTARDPVNRFQSAREMLDHWWNVMASFDEDATTDIMRGMGKVIDAPRTPTSPPSTLPRLSEDEGQADDRTIRRLPKEGLPPLPKRASVPASGPVPPDPGSDRTIQRPSPFEVDPLPLLHPADDEPVPHTIRSLRDEETAAYIEGADPFDLPTKSDPNLRKLVEQELALQKLRKERG